MAFFMDRDPRKPNRYLVTPENGTPFYAQLERADEPVFTGTPLNAATFNAMVRSVTAVNLLDNSDFRYPVNQRGGTTYHGSVYTIDRWRTGGKLSLTVEDGFINISCASDAENRNGLAQDLAPEKTPAPGTMVTVVYQDAVGDIWSDHGVMPETGYIKLFGSSGVGVNLYSAESGARISFMVPPGGHADLTQIALYEGAYLPDMLPQYRRKDYAVELMECMRYYQIRSTNDVAAADLRPAMRAVPTITKVNGGYAYSADL